MSKPNVPLSLCAQCGANLDAATIVQKKGTRRTDAVQARSGDMSVCVYCGCIHKFDSDIHLRKATNGDLTACMLTNQETYDILMKTQEAILLFIKEFPDLVPKAKPYGPF